MKKNKFKVWDVNNKKMSTAYSLSDLFLNCDGGLFYGHLDWPDVGSDDIIYLEYIGLKDKNGREIYYGDCPGGIFERSYFGWCEKCKQVQLLTNRIYDYGPCQACEGDVPWFDVVEHIKNEKIIGNIYENPELLK